MVDPYGLEEGGLTEADCFELLEAQIADCRKQHPCDQTQCMADAHAAFEECVNGTLPPWDSLPPYSPTNPPTNPIGTIPSTPTGTTPSSTSTPPMSLLPQEK